MSLATDARSCSRYVLSPLWSTLFPLPSPAYLARTCTTQSGCQLYPILVDIAVPVEGAL
jgi:hypothetical protein